MKPIHKILLIITISCSFQFSNAQNELIDWSPTLEVPKSEEIIDYTLVDDTIPALISKYGEAIIMRSFTKPAQEYPLFIRTEQDPKLEAFNLIDDKLVTLVSEKSEDQSNFSIITYQLTSRQAEKIVEQPIHPSQKLSLNNSRELFFSVSKNASHVLLCQQSAYEKQSKTAFSVITHHNDKIEQISLPSEFEGDDVTLLGATIDNAGIVYFATETGIKLNSPFRKKYLVYSYHPASKTLTEFDLTSNEFFILDLVVTTTDKGAVITCLYSTDPLEEDKSSGYTFVKLHENGLEIDKRLAGNFDENMVRLFGEDESELRSIKDLFLSKTIDVNDDYWLVMEKRYKSRVCTADPHTGIMTCSDQYHFNAVAFENILNPNKTVTIDKRQIDYDSPSIFTKQAITQHNNDIFMFYNDHFKNSDGSHEHTMSNTNRSVLRFAKMSGNSILMSGVVQNKRQTGFVFVSAFGIPQYKNYSFLLSADGKLFRVGKLDLNQLNEAK